MAFTFADMVAAALDKLPLDGHFETILPRQKWLFNDLLWTKDKLRMPGGKEDEFWINYRIGTSAQYTEAGAIRNPTFGKHLVKGNQPLVSGYFEVAYVEEELETRGYGGPFEDGSWSIVNYIKSRRQSELLGWYNKLEDDFLKLPILTGTQKSMWGLPYHMNAITTTQMNGTTPDGAFQGENPLTHASSGASAGSDWCGIDVSTSTSTYAALQSYNFGWDSASAAAVSMTETNRARLAEAFLMLDFEGPINVADLSMPNWNRFRVFTDKFMINKFGIAARVQNDSLGADVLKYLGSDVSFTKSNNGVIVNGMPIRWAPTLDSPTAEDILARGYHPFCGVNMDHLHIVYRPQKFMKRRPVASDKVNRPDVYVEYVDSIWNLRCDNPQQLGFSGSWIA